MLKLVEFKNHKNETLRGLFSQAKSSSAIIFIHGFERTTIEYKFTNIIDKLSGKANLFRFDFSGCGFSGGKFGDLTVEKYTLELELAIVKLSTLIFNLQSITLVAHSLGGCICLNLLQEKYPLIKKLVLLGPAFNQEGLLKYFFTRIIFKNKININWQNFRKHFPEKKYQLFLKQKKYLRKAHYLSNKYFQENKDLDYQDLFPSLTLPLNKILIIQGTKDAKVPRESNHSIPSEVKQIIVKGSDHEFERPDFVKQYLSKVVRFILN